jgi:hypothetical protein
LLLAEYYAQIKAKAKAGFAGRRPDKPWQRIEPPAQNPFFSDQRKTADKAAAAAEPCADGKTIRKPNSTKFGVVRILGLVLFLD